MTIATVMVRMTTAKILKAYRLLFVTLMVMAVAALHVLVVAVLLEAGKASDATRDESIWLNTAEFISWSNPEVFAEQARYHRKHALLQQEQNLSEKPHLKTSLNYWQQAQAASPLWPYYQLASLDIEVLLASPAEAIQKRISSILNLAPNERGLDKYLLQLSFIAWPKLNESQQQYMLALLKKSNNGVLSFVYKKAKEAGHHQAICLNLPWKKVRRLCR